MEELNLYESRLDFYSIKKLAASHRPAGQFSSLSVKSYFKGTDVCLKLVSQASLLAYSAPKTPLWRHGSSTQRACLALSSEQIPGQADSRPSRFQAKHPDRDLVKSFTCNTLEGFVRTRESEKTGLFQNLVEIL